MYISKIFVNGYKTLYDFKLYDLNPGLNVFIGENNVGKSNILKGLDIFFNKEAIIDSDRSILFDYALGNNKSKKMKIEVEFSKPVPFEQSANITDEKSKRVVAEFADNNKKQFSYYSNNNNLRTIEEAEVHKYFPNFVYIGDLNEEKKFKIETLFEIFPEITHSDIMEIETYANNFLKHAWDENIFISIKSISDEKRVIVADEYGNANEFQQKSSGIQQLVFMSLFLGLNLTVGTNKVIIALEEPEANLHLKLQKQLFALLRLVSGKVQTFLSTHSVAFIDTMNSKEVFHIVRNKNGQTEINTNVIHNNWQTLRRDLGLSINDSLLFGQNNLVVEGITEKILLPFLIDSLNKKELIKFSDSDVNIISAEGATNVPYFVKLIDELKLNNIIILDKDKGGNNAQRAIENQIPRLKDNIIQLEKEGYREIEFEDLFSDEIIAKALSKVYGVEVTVEDILSARKASGNSKFSDMVVKLEVDKEFSVRFDDIGKHKLARNIRYIIQDESNIPQEITNLLQEIDKKIKGI